MMQEAFALPVGEGLTLRGNWHADETKGTKQPILLFCHGFKGFKDWGSFPYAADALARRGIVTIRFNFSCNGVGESLDRFDELEKFGINTYAREQADLTALWEAIRSKQLPLPDFADKQKLYVLGHSKGGADAILFGAGHPDVSGIITWNGVADVNLFDENLRSRIEQEGVGYVLNARTGQNMPITRVVIEDVDNNKEAYDLLKKVAAMKQPLCIIQGRSDAARLVKAAEQLKHADEDAELHWIEGADHTFNTRHPFAGTTPQLEEAIKLTADFVHRQ